MVEFREIRPGRWAKLNGGQVIGMASPAEVAAWPAAQPGKARPTDAPAAVALDDQAPRGELWEPLPLFAISGGDGGPALGMVANPMIGQQVAGGQVLGEPWATDGPTPGELHGPDLDGDQLDAGELGQAHGDQAGELGQPGGAAAPVDGPNPAPVLSPTAAAGDDPASLWLWVDPSMVPGYKKETFDPAAFLARAAALFQSKPWTGGRRPGRLGVNPENLIGNGLEAAAAGLGLRVMADPTVAKGTYRLALERE